MKYANLGALFITGAIALAGAHTSALAASATTQAFLENLIPNVDFLDRSSRLALTNSKNAHLHDFAFSEAKEQTLAANALDEWTHAPKSAVAVTVSVDGDQLQTGRSVALNGQTAPIVDNRLPRGEEDVSSLEGQTGADFDIEYKAKQVDALRQVEADYRDYIVKGDDPVLLGIASRELPKVRHRLALLGKV